MATIINLGKVKFEFKGDYSNTVTYNVDDIVVYQNAKFIYKNGTSTSNNDPLIRDTNWQYSAAAEVRDPAMKKFKVNTTYWDYFESENQFGEYVGNWSNSTIYLTGQVVTGASGAAYYAKRTSKGDDPVFNNYGTWELYIEGGPVIHDRKITRLVNENPVGWRGHPKLSLHANTGWANTWNGNIPLNTYGANGQSELYNAATPTTMTVHGGFVGVKWDGSLAGWGWSGFYSGPYNAAVGQGGEISLPYDPNVHSRFYYDTAVRTSPLYGGHDTDNQYVNADEYTLPALQNVFDTPGTSGWPTIMSIAGGTDHGALMSDGTITLGIDCGFNSSSNPGGATETDEHTSGNFSYSKQDFGNKRIVKLAMACGDLGTQSAPGIFNLGHAIALDEDGEIWIWGDNTYGQCGVGPELGSDPKTTYLGGFAEDNIVDVTSPVKIPLSQFENERIVDCWAVGSTFGMSMVLTQAGYLWTCGYNGLGQLGHPTNTGTQTATHCSIFRKIDLDWNAYNGIQKILISGWERYQTVYILDGAGHVWSWGYNGVGNLGDGSTTNHSNTVDVAASPATYRRTSWPQGNTTVNMWATGHYNFGNLWTAQANGAVYGVGHNGYYELNNSTLTNSTTDQTTPVIASDISYPIKIHNDTGGLRSGAIICLTKDRDVLVMPQNGATYTSGLGELGNNNTNYDIAQRDGAGSRSGRTDVSQYGWKELAVPSYMHKDGSKAIDVRADGHAFLYSTSNYYPWFCTVLTQDGRLKHFGTYTAHIISDGREEDARALADFMYWGS